MARVVNFGYKLGETSIYPKFGHMLAALMVRVQKELMNELRREVVAHVIDT